MKIIAFGPIIVDGTVVSLTFKTSDELINVTSSIGMDDLVEQLGLQSIKAAQSTSDVTSLLVIEVDSYADEHFNNYRFESVVTMTNDDGTVTWDETVVLQPVGPVVNLPDSALLDSERAAGFSLGSALAGATIALILQK